MKQRESARSKANASTQERLIARETFQYVTTNPKKYGVASTRNERQLAKAMDTLHMQQNKRLAKLSSEIHEVKVHQWRLKEVDETTRDPTTSEEKLLGPTAEEVIDETEPKNRGAVVTRGRIIGIKHSKTPSTRNEEGLDRVRKNRPMTSGDISPKTRASRLKANDNGKILKYDRIYGYDTRLAKAEDLYKTTNGLNRQSLTPQGVPVDYTLKDVPIRRDPHAFKYKYKSYNLMNAQKSTGKRGNSPQDSTKHTRETRNELQGTNDSREKISVNKNHIGKINTKPDTRPRSGHVPKVSETDPINYGHRVAVHNDLPSTHATYKEAKGSSVHFHEGRAVNHEREAVISDHETGGHERPSVVEENWAETLKSCRYLRKPRGYETPEIPIESIFQNDSYE